MKILWVEDFDNGSVSNRIPMTHQWLEKILCSETKQRLKSLEGGTPDPISFLTALAENERPIVWADDLASGLVAMTLGTSAYQGNMFSKIPSVDASYELALLDLAIPYRRGDGQLSKYYSSKAQDILDAEDKNLTFALEKSDLHLFPGIILAMRLLQQGMPADRIFFLTANKDIPGSISSRSIAGPDLLKKNIISKTDISEIIEYLENNAYYQLKTLIRKSLEDIRTSIQNGSYIGTLPLDKLIFADKEATITFLDSCLEILPEHVNRRYRQIFYNNIINMILIEFSPYEKQDISTPCIEAFYIILLRYLRNINAHTSYLKKATELETGIIVLIFIGFLISIYRKENDSCDYSSIIKSANMFFNNPSISGNFTNLAKNYDSINSFINSVGNYYLNIVKPDRSSEFENRFAAITSNLSNDLSLSAWDILKMTFWSQVSYTKSGGGTFTHMFNFKLQALMNQPFFKMLYSKLTLDRKSHEQE